MNGDSQEQRQVRLKFMIYFDAKVGHRRLVSECSGRDVSGAQHLRSHVPPAGESISREPQLAHGLTG